MEQSSPLSSLLFPGWKKSCLNDILVESSFRSFIGYTSLVTNGTSMALCREGRTYKRKLGACSETGTQCCHCSSHAEASGVLLGLPLHKPLPCAAALGGGPALLCIGRCESWELAAGRQDDVPNIYGSGFQTYFS